jgi:hypothetical protein
VLRCFTCAAHAHATACRAESFVGSDAPVRAANVADQVFDAIAAEGKLNPAALQRLLPHSISWCSPLAAHMLLAPLVLMFSLSSRTKGWCRNWWQRAAGRCTWWRARATSHTVSTWRVPSLLFFTHCLAIAALSQGPAVAGLLGTQKMYEGLPGWVDGRLVSSVFQALLPLPVLPA